MHVCSEGPRIAFQPEDRREELALFRLFSVIEPPECWFTLDIADYSALDHGLALRASSDDRAFAPGERALIIDEAPEMPTRADE